MADVTRVVETIYKVIDKASKPVAAIGGAAWGAASKLSSLMNPLVALGGAVASLATAKGLIQLGNQAEGLRLSIAGTYRAFSVVGKSMKEIDKQFKAGTDGWVAAQHSAFMQAQDMAKTVLGQIEKDAAKLPGTAEDYAEVYRTALPAAIAAGMTDVQKVADFTNKFAATAIANQIDAQQAGRDMAMILRGHAGAQVRTWSVLMPLIGKSAEEFNKMNAPARIKATQAAIAKYQPLLNEFGDTWDAIYGTTEATFKVMARNASNPFFEASKSALKEVNTWLDANSALITGPLTKGFEKLVSLGEKLAGSLKKVNFGKIKENLTGNGRVGKALGVMSAVRMGAMFGPLGAIAGLGAGAMARKGGVNMDSIGPVLEKVTAFVGTALDRLWPFISTVGEVAGTLLESLMPAVSIVGKSFVDLLDNVKPLLPALGSGLADIVKNLTPAFAGLMKGVVELVPLFIGLAQGIVQITVGLTAWMAKIAEWVPDAVLPKEVIEAREAAKADALDKAANTFQESWYRSSETVRAQNENWAKTVMENVDLGKVMNQGFSAAADSYNGASVKVVATVNDFHESLQRAGEPLAEFGSATQQAEMLLTMSVMGMASPMGSIANSLVDVNEKLVLFGEGVGDAATAASAIASMGIGGFGAAVYANRDKFMDATKGDRAASAVKPDIPGARGGGKTHNDFRYSRFDITQKFAEGFDPDRIAIAFASDLSALADQKLTSGLAPIHGSR